MDRYTLELPALVSVHGQDTKPLSLALLTENVCAGGAFFPCSRPLAVSTRVDIGILLPINVEKKERAETAHIQVSGRVVRRDADGMAIRFDNNYRLKSFLD